MNRKDLGRRQWHAEELATPARGRRPQGLNKADLVDLISERVGSPKKEAVEVIEAVFAIIRESLRHGSKVKISGFGSFLVNHKRARRGRDPQTGAPITICSRRVISFKPSQILKDRVNNGSPGK
jgi:integration host factor subunit alpha